MKVIPPAVKIKHVRDGTGRNEWMPIIVPLRDKYWLKFHRSLLTTHFYIDEVLAYVQLPLLDFIMEKCMWYNIAL